MGYKDPEQQREYQRRWKDQRRAEFFAGKQCVNCGAREHLELDHVDPSQKVSHRIWSWSRKRREAEIAKCQVLCSPCHQEKTTVSRAPQHGTYSCYTLGCRRPECREAKNAYQREYRARATS